MPAAPRHAKPRTSAIRIGAPVLAAATLAGVAAAFVSLHGGPAAAGPPRGSTSVTSAGQAFTTYQMTTAVHRDAAALEAHAVRRAARRTHLAGLAAARHRAARQQAQLAQQAQQAVTQPPPSPSRSPSPTATPSGGGDAASSALGVCIRDAEEGGSYAWGPGNGGGAYQFVLGTWETYGGAASEYGVAGASYQNQIFDNAIAAGGASNWTDYDGC
jgi:hypothetical protein